MAFLELTGDERSIYAITGDGSLLWYRDDLKDGTNGPDAERGWAPASGSQIGFGWDQFADVVAGGNGVIYAILESGELLWYRDDLRDGTMALARNVAGRPAAATRSAPVGTTSQSVFPVAKASLRHRGDRRTAVVSGRPAGRN